MGASRTLTRRIDPDLVIMIELGTRPAKVSHKAKYDPRPAHTYCAYKRNLMRSNAYLRSGRQ